MKNVKYSLSYMSLNDGMIDSYCFPTVKSLSNEQTNSTNTYTRESDVCSVDPIHFTGRKSYIIGPYEIMDMISKDLDGQLSMVFGDKAIYIMAIAKVRAATDTEGEELKSAIYDSVFSSVFESFDFDGFFSSIENDKIQYFLQKYSSTACSFISEIKNTDLRNRAIVEVRTKINLLSRRENYDEYIDLFSLIDLLSFLYYVDIIKLLIGNFEYAHCNASQLIKIASKYTVTKDGSRETSATHKEQRFIDSLDLSKVIYA